MSAQGTGWMASVVVPVLVGVFLLQGCAPATPAGGGAGGKTRETAIFRLDYLVAGSHAAVFLAQEKGFFDEEGLALEIYEGRGSATTVKLIGAGQGEFGQADYGTMTPAIGEGLPVKGVFAAIQKNPLRMVVREDSGIKEPKDLKGKTIANVPGGAQAVMLPAFLAANGLSESDVKFVNMDASQQRPSFFEKKVDAIMNWATSNPLEPLAEKEKIKIRLMPFSDYGVDMLSTGFLVSNKTIAERPELIRRFMRAAARGFEAAVAQPEAAVQATLKRYPDRDGDMLLLELRNIIAHLHTKGSESKPIGWAAEQDWANTINLINKYGGKELKTTNPKDYYTNDFIPQK
ncbi:MAG: ABC transporter substrate-binding protein [Chloroflexi bacterium]|nr:ABC transporter substrate-binding protein [Chloroflexota bacterium]